MRKPDGLTLLQEKTLQDFDEKISKSAETRLLMTPEQEEALWKVIRRSTETGSLVKLKRFLRDSKIDIAAKDLMSFRDYLIIRTIELKDLEPDARARLRDRLLAIEDPREMTDDYRRATCSGAVPRCRDCRWFMAAPQDSDDDGEKSCVEMGTKGTDQACLGYTFPPN